MGKMICGAMFYLIVGQSSQSHSDLQREARYMKEILGPTR